MQLLSISKKSVFFTLFGIFLMIQSHRQSKIPDAHVTCIYSEDCILPCTFPPSLEGVVFQWYKQETLIFSFLEDKDESVHSDISVFTDEVSHGNASLLLEDSSIRSRGQYKCVVNTTKSVWESNVIVKVEAPISGITIGVIPTQHVQCSSHGVYPAPLLKWSTDPSLARTSPQAVTRMSADSNDLFSIVSTLKKMSTNLNLTYICSITSKYSLQSWRASLLQTEMTVHFGQHLVIPCMAPKNIKNLTLTWTFINSSGFKLWMAALIVAAVALPCVIYCIYNKCKVSQLKHYGQDPQQDTEMQAMHKDNSVEDLPTENKPLAEYNNEDL
ncbi:V-set domain-containing T-cell activation inhibitor 1-like isoform X2 [Silurus meridionalis]|uniref:V-set domain-containing T-cell activation inhibitor 1-like isoform X2 n=1 Tax=Silurus meridionalis TaxID=175797 RepID=UPI001EEA143E|nr:V-set domain-containing T-cell activation inhibitor 1-like isoform X2 [Silurus meridionalis]